MQNEEELGDNYVVLENSCSNMRECCFRPPIYSTQLQYPYKTNTKAQSTKTGIKMFLLTS